MSKKAKIIISAGVSALCIAAVVAGVITYPLIKMYFGVKKHEFSQLSLEQRGDRIYFLNTKSADAILLESQGKFALIDAAEDSDNPRGFPELEYDGTEEYVLNCVKKIAGDKNGKATLEFVLGTHAHSDHLGGFDTLILDEDITVNQAYIKEYDAGKITEYEVRNWDNQEVYDQFITACEKRDVPVTHDIPQQSFQFGKFQITFYNTRPVQAEKPVGENESSVCTLVEKDDKRALLTGDLNNNIGGEDHLAAEVGKVDLLKAGHHGYEGSTTKAFALALDPDIAILTNTVHGMHKPVLRALNAAGASIYATKEHQGIVAEFVNGEIKLYDNIDGAVK